MFTKDFLNLVMIVTFCLASGLSQIACDATHSAPPISEAPLPSQGQDEGVKNVILFIGDGMGVQQISLLNLYRDLMTPDLGPTSFQRLLENHHWGLANTYMLGGLVVDSAASATQIACGIQTRTQVIGLDEFGYPCRTVLEEAHDLGKATGLITDTRVTHATPAAFAAKQVRRSYESQIAEDLITGVSKDKVDVMLGGGARYLIPQSTRFSDVPGCGGVDSSVDGSSSRSDAQDLIATAQAQGYQFACTADQLDNIPAVPGQKILGVFARSGFPAYPERATVPGVPSILSMTQKAVSVLEKDPDGFFLMVEAGQIDWGAHENDGAFVLEAMKQADRTIDYLMDYVVSHPDTLLIVTADHETGGMGFSYHEAPDIVQTLPSGLVHTTPYDFGVATEVFNHLTAQTMSYGGIINPVREAMYLSDYQPNPAYPLEQAVQDLIARVAQYTSYTMTEEQAISALYVEPGTELLPMPGGHAEFCFDSPWQNRLSMQFVRDNNLVWATGTHTSTPVYVMAMGPEEYARRVSRHGHLMDVGLLIFQALNDQDEDQDEDEQ